MTLKAMDGFDAYADVSQLGLRAGYLRWQASSGAGLAPGRDGFGQSVQLPPGSALTGVLSEDLQPGIMALALRVPSGALLRISLLSDATQPVVIEFGSRPGPGGSLEGYYLPLLKKYGVPNDYSASNLVPSDPAVDGNPRPLDGWFYFEFEFNIRDTLGADWLVAFAGTVGGNGARDNYGLTDDARTKLYAPPPGGRCVNRIIFEAFGTAPSSLDDLVLSSGVLSGVLPQGGTAFDTTYGDRRILAMVSRIASYDAGWAPGGLSVPDADNRLGQIYALQAVGIFRGPAGTAQVTQRLVLGDATTTPPTRTMAASAEYLANAFATRPGTGLPWGIGSDGYATEYGVAHIETLLQSGATTGGEAFEFLYAPATGLPPPPPPANPLLPDFEPEPYVTPWTIRPDWKDGVTERLQWLTDVLISQDGAEQRRRLRQSPRRIVEARFTLWGDRLRLYDSYMAGPQASVWRVPLWWERNRLVLPADPNSRSLTFRFPGSEIAPGDTVMLVADDPFTYDLALVSGTGEGGVVLATRLARSWPEGTSCYPTKKAILAGNQSATRRSDNAIQVQLEFQVIEPNDYPAVQGSAVSYPSPADDDRNLPLFPHAPDWATDTTLEHQRMLALFDNQTGLVARRDTALRAFRVQQFYYTMRGRAEAAAFRSTLYYFAGRLRPVWLPTFMRDFDFVPGGQHAAGSNFLAVRRSGYTELGTTGPVGSHTGREVLLIAWRDGTLALYGVAGYVLTDADTETIQLDRPLDRLASPATVLRMSFVQVVRQDQDEVTLAHVSDLDGVTQATTTFRSCDVARRCYPYAAFDPGRAASPRADQSQGDAPGTAPVTVDPVSLALTGGAG